MLSAVQSEYFFNEDSDSAFVCSISSISASVSYCAGTKTKTVQAIYPVVHRFNTTLNKRSLIYPPTTATNLSALSSLGSVFTTTPNCSSNVNVTDVRKPLIAFNEETNLYNITFLGQFAEAGSNSLGIFTYYFQDVHSHWHLYDSVAYLPSANIHETQTTFEDGKISTDFYIRGTKSRSDDVNRDIAGFRGSNHVIFPSHDRENSTLDFCVANYHSTDSPAASANTRSVYGYCGGFITEWPDIPGRLTKNQIRVEFSMKSYFLNPQTAFLLTPETDSTALTATRVWNNYTISGANRGEGFSVVFYEQKNEDLLEIVSVETGLGYVAANGAADLGGIPQYGPNTNQRNYLGVGFDIGGGFCTTSQGKSGSIDGTVYTTLSGTIGIRSSDANIGRVLSRSDQITDVPLLTSVGSFADAPYIDYRVDLTEQGQRVLVYGKISTNSTYTLLHSTRISDYNFLNIPPERLKVALVCMTSNKVSNYKLLNFSIKGTK